VPLNKSGEQSTRQEQSLADSASTLFINSWQYLQLTAAWSNILITELHEYDSFFVKPKNDLHMNMLKI